MGLLKIDSNLTGGDDPARVLAMRTYAGMAFFAGTGPQGERCGGCANWQGSGHKHNPCAQYQRMMQSQVGPKVPYDAGACKFFEKKGAA